MLLLNFCLLVKGAAEYEPDNGWFEVVFSDDVMEKVKKIWLCLGQTAG